MSSPKAQATAIASMLSAQFGNAPDVDESEARIRLEATVPSTLSESARLDLLTFLSQTADRFGHHLDKDGTSRIWAEVNREEAPIPPARRRPDDEQRPDLPEAARAGATAQADESEGQA